MRHSCVRCSNTSCEYFWFLRSSKYSQASNSSLVLKTGIVCGASGRFNLTQVGLHWDAFSFSIVASDSWFNPISRRNHSCVVSGSGFIALSAVGPWPLKTRLPNRLLKAVVVAVVVAAVAAVAVVFVAVVAVGVVVVVAVVAVVVVVLRFTTLAQDISDYDNSVPFSRFKSIFFHNLKEKTRY